MNDEKKTKKWTEKLNSFKTWCEDYKSDFKKIIFSFLMGYSSVIVVVLILVLNNKEFFSILKREEVIFSILGCCSSLLALASVSIEKNKTSIKLLPLCFNILAILPVFGFMSYFLENNNETGINITLLVIITIIGVVLSFYYLIHSTNEERNKRKEYEKESKKLRKDAENTNQGQIGGKSVEV